MIKNVYWSSCRVPVIVVRFRCSLNFLERISKNRHKIVFSFPPQLLSETFLILRRTERDMIKNVYWSLCTRRVPVFVVRFRCSLNSLDRISKNTLISNPIKFRPVAAELLHSDRQTDRHDVTNSRFSQFFENRPKPDGSSASQELPLLSQNCTVSPPLPPQVTCDVPLKPIKSNSYPYNMGAWGGVVVKALLY